ncbi:hypothetical protein LGH83_04480 [Lichenihabitans sp. PAMC28606]|uniref:hypothetical protein n=1 Tax=Lichenihabitans sp. PAMC28606 TaxID=2880932 RepID=UPI001D0A4514|nr:hypothetical protein [Lichenihabitans sp. PAMC28606]UDL95483.1 hypothetical protein LGH83_04480 [Lichenihabitans sp. PAMC28606]
MSSASRPLVVERRSLAADRPGFRPKRDAAAELHDVASTMTHLPGDCFRDPAELVTLMRRLAGRLVKVAETGLEVAPSYAARAPRQPFLCQPRADARAITDAVFGKRPGAGQRSAATTRPPVRVEVRRGRFVSPAQMLLPLLPTNEPEAR